jgi:hypothetical protein
VRGLANSGFASDGNLAVLGFRSLALPEPTHGVRSGSSSVRSATLLSFPQGATAWLEPPTIFASPQPERGSRECYPGTHASSRAAPFG